MKNNYIKLVWILLLSISFVPVIQAQSPAKMSYQAVIRDADSQLLSNTQVSMQISILQGSADGIAVYIETQTPTSNANGLVSIEIGAGTSSDDLSTIDWANGPYFIKTETDPDGGTNYSITGTSQLLSVPYALHAKTAETVTGGISETDPEFTGSEAANITASDIAKLGNLSGINTGDQNLDALATKTSLAGLENKMDDGDAALKGLIDDNTSYISTNATNISINVQAIKDTASAIRAGIPDVSGFATIAELDADSTYLKGLIDTETGNREDSDDALAAKISSDSTFLKGLIDGNTQAIKDTASAIRAGIPDVSGFATIAELDADSTYLKGLIDTEISDRKAVDAALSTRASSDSTYFEGLISDEETARIAADAAINTEMDADSTFLKGLIDGNTQAIKDTASAIRAGIPDVSGFATIAELDADSTYLKGLIDTEISDRKAAGAALSTKASSDSTYFEGLISDEETARIAADAAINTEMDADSTFLKGLIDTEISDRKAVDAALASKASSDSTYFEGLISDEETARIAADAAINTELDADSTFLKGFIDGNTQAIKDTASAIRADIPDVSGFATVAELDADSTYLKGLIDGNTQAIKDTASAIRAGIPDVSGFATLTKVRNDSTFLKGLIDDNATIISTNTTDINNLETYAITSAGTSGQVWISDGDGAGSWADAGSSSGVPTGTNTGDMQYWNGTAWVTVAATTNEGAILQMIGGVPTWTGGTPPTPNVTNATTGKTWMDRNLGASQVATSSTDIAAYGDLYQWGRAADGHESRTSGTTSTLATSDTPGHGDFITSGSSPYDWRNPQNDNLWQGVSGTNNPCPTGYRLPTDAEWDAERTSWSSNNAAGAFASPLKLPLAGYRLGSDGALGRVGSYGRYWSSTVVGTYYARNLLFLSSNALWDSGSRAHGCSVRCLKD